MGILGDIIGGIANVGQVAVSAGQAANEERWNQRNYEAAKGAQAFNEAAWQKQYDFGREQFEYSKSADQRAYEFGLQQFDFSKSQHEYQVGQNELTRQREDNAVQRRVADLKAAGLSPTLAAGSAAGAVSMSGGSGAAGSVPSGGARGSVSGSSITPASRKATSMAAVANALVMSRNLARQDKEIELLDQETKLKASQVDESMARSTGLTYSNQAQAYANALMEERWAMETGRYEREGKSLASAIREADARINAMNAASALSAQNLVESKYNLGKYMDVGVATDAPAATKNATSVVNAAKSLWEKYGTQIKRNYGAQKRKYSEYKMSDADKARIHHTELGRWLSK